MAKWINDPIPRRRPAGSAAYQESGIVVILVVGVLATLLLIAVPFSISMIHHERGARAGLADAQARLAAEGARAFAVHQLYATNDFVERGSAPVSGTLLSPPTTRGGGRPQSGRVLTRAPYDDPYVDARSEQLVDVTLADQFFEQFRPRLDPPDDWGREFRTADPVGAVWGVTVQDEQGKINRLTAPARLLTALINLVPPSRLNITPHLTEYSLRPAKWIFPQNFRGFAPGTGGVLVDDNSHFGRQAKVRLTLGSATLETQVDSYNPDGTPVIGVPGSFANPATVIEVECRHPVNVNTATEEVLTALFDAIHVYNQVTGAFVYKVPTDAARKVARRLASSHVSSWTDLDRIVLATPDVKDGDKSLILRNAKDPTNRRFGGGGTLPFCFHNEDVFGFEAWGAINDPAGNQVARRGFREVIELTPPEPMAWLTQSQYDFERMHSTFPTGPTPFRYPFGYPFGHKIVTRARKVFIGEEPDRSWTSGTAELRMVPALDAWGDGIAWEEHYLGEEEGLEVTGPQTFPIGQILAKNGTVDVSTGGLGFWFKLKAVAGDVYFFDTATGKAENRLACFYHDGKKELVLRACDSTLDPSAAEVRMPFVPREDVWYHLQAHWKGTKHGQLALLLDGMSSQDPSNPAKDARFTHVVLDPDPKKDDYRLNDVLATLGGAISATDTNLTLQPAPGTNLRDFPDRNGVIEIGQEAIEYDRFNNGRPSGVRRGMRGSGDSGGSTKGLPPVGRDPTNSTVEGKPHAAGAAVTVYGYSNPLKSFPRYFTNTVAVTLDRLTVGGGLVTARFGPATFTRILEPGDPFAVPPDPGGIDSNATTIPVAENSTADFPEPGYLVIGGREVVRYDRHQKGTKTVVDPTDPAGKTVRPDLFTGCVRGQLGTVAQDHGDGSSVELFSIAVTENGGYLDPAIVQIDDEWFAPVRKGPDGFLTGVVDGHDGPIRIRRGYVNTTVTAHEKDALVVPVFGVRDPECGRGDIVTILYDGGPKQQAVVRNIRRVRRQVPGVRIDDYLVAFGGFTGEYAVSSRDARLLKWPSGELPSTIPAAWNVGTSWDGSRGGLSGWIDEVKAVRSGEKDREDFFEMYDSGPKQNWRVFSLSAAVSPVVRSVRVKDDTGGLADDGGMIKIGDEYIPYVLRTDDPRVTRGSTLDPAARGFIESRAAAHDEEERAFYLKPLPVAALAQGVGAEDFVLPLTPKVRGFRGQEGFVRVDNEVIGFTGVGTSLTLPADAAGKGVYRGAFGTQPVAHLQNAIVYGLPFRYWGFWRAEAFDDTMPYWSGALTRPGAVWRRIEWKSVPDAAKMADVVVHVRFDGKPGWETPPTNRAGGIYEFRTTKSGSVAAGGNRLDVQAETAEVRVYFSYEPLSYDPMNLQTAHSWKATPILRELTVEYERESITRFHEEK